jgi:DNA polymerase epsilon subunit 1
MRLVCGNVAAADARRWFSQSYWQVIQMAQTATPGLFKMWMLVDGSLYSVPITVPRRFYINLAQPDVEADCGRGIRKRVNLTLPHSHPTLNLYEVDVSEQEMVAGSQEMQEQMSHPDVEGVYESKVPLLFQALLSIGCVVQVAKHARDRPLAEGFCTDELEFKSTMECAYVEPPADGIPALQHVSVYHSRSADAMRGVYAIMLPALHKCVTLVVSPFANREVAAPVLQRWYHDALPAGEPGVTFELHYVTSDVDAHKRIHKELEAYAQQHRNPIVALVESPVDVSELTAKVPFLQGVPCVAVAGNLFDGQYAALGWQGPALRVAAERTAALGTWLDERVRLARYTHMPLGNLGSDWTLHIADVFFARALRDAKMLLWASSTGEHDLGGMQLREAVSALFCEESHQPRAVCNPGAYRRVCVSLRVHHLAVNALVAAATMSEMEGGNLNDDPGEHVEGAAAALPAFRVLRAMVLSWLSEANDRHNVFADTLLMQLFRWLCSPQSALQDPMLRQLVTTCMHKVFRLLLAELRKLGCTIVYADFNQILLCTGKHSVESAQGYVESLRATIRSRDLFKWIEMSPEQTWHSLLYRDPYNHGGIVGCSSDDDDQTTADGENPMRTGGAATKIFSCWNMAEYLPPAVQEYFELVVSEFVYLPWKDTQRLLGATVAVPRSRHTLDGDSDSDVEPREPPALTPAALLNAQELVKAERVFLEEQLESYFTEKMLRVVRDMERHMGTGAADVSDPAHTFPRRCGSHLTEAELGPPALAFVRAVLEVLLLDKEMELPVALLRRNLLRLLHVGEFCAAAAFRDPCVSYVLKDVICTYCNDCRDLDLCRDVALQERQWQCAMPTCQQPYDIAAIEHTLVQVVRQRAHTFQLQDLACVKCKQVKRGHAAAQCQCAGAFRVSDAPTTARHGLRVFHNIADWHGFEMLGETVDWLLQTSG